MMTPESGSAGLNQPPDARYALFMTAAQAAKAGLLERWQEAHARRFKKIARQAHLKAELESLVKSFDTVVAEHGWSERKMQRESGLNRTAWRRIRAGNHPPKVAILKIQAALNKVLAARH